MLSLFLRSTYEDGSAMTRREIGDGQATIIEVQRNRTVSDFVGRHVQVSSYDLGEWIVLQGYSIMVSSSQLHGAVRPATIRRRQAQRVRLGPVRGYETCARLGSFQPGRGKWQV
ncbi:hypothetical protein [Candidatus Mycolicibacterium alkanivorans]|uniref:hypothetical protein n=1 Tax=Candidatus Mycolicibacterium alkanivorans TaxID=2954114 RepID=UPI0035588623